MTTPDHDDGFNPLGCGPDPEIRLRPAPDTREDLFNDALDRWLHDAEPEVRHD